jgi:hypothetical protein
LNGTCAAPCVAGTAECDNDAATQCETNIKTDPAHCGDCDTSCTLDHAESACAGGYCKVDSCKAPYEDCDGNAGDGCEKNLSTDPDNCGACGKKCSTHNGTPACANASCTFTCNEGFDDCDKEPGNGCEASTSTDVANCGGCGHACVARAGETPYCQNGQCGSTSCAEGTGNCNGSPADGCEADFSSDVNNCGKCGAQCSVENGTAACVDGHCVVKGCNGGFGNCDASTADGGYANGCETNVDSSLDHCGKCGAACSADNATAQCSEGKCQVKTCTAPYQDCDGDGLDCETNIQTSATNCGGCGSHGIDCSSVFPNGLGTCSGASCQLAGCAPNFGNCDNNLVNGCETDVRSDVQHCGDCRVSCKTTNASGTACTTGTCRPSCNPGFGACTDASLGCTDRLDTPAHCGSCTNSCTSSAPFCVSGQCVPQLTIELLDSDTVASTGPSGSNSLSLTHALRSDTGQYRLVVLGLATLAPNLAAAQAATVKYGDTQMTRLGTVGTAPAYTSIFYLTDAQLPSIAGSSSRSQSVVVSSNVSGQTIRFIANVIELRGVDQANPFDYTQPLTSTGCTAVKSGSIQSGSGDYVYSIAAFEWGSVGSATGGLTRTMALDASYQNLNGEAGYMGPVGAGSHTVGYATGDGCNHSAQYLLSIQPAKKP